jgi:phospholipid/cholesterol/gamma-HCH transport system ATP-binding protein
VNAPPVIELAGIATRFGRQQVHDGLDLVVRAGELMAIIGGSGTGKSVLLREIVGLHRPDAGTVKLLGVDMWDASRTELAAVRRRFGMMFQDGALFSSLSVAANVAVPLRESGLVPESLIEPLVALRLSQAGLPADRVACASGPPLPVHLRSNPRCCSSTSPHRVSTRSPHGRSTNCCAACARIWGLPWWS